MIQETYLLDCRLVALQAILLPKLEVLQQGCGIDAVQMQGGEGGARLGKRAATVGEVQTGCHREPKWSNRKERRSSERMKYSRDLH